MARPWYKRYPGDFIAGTALMSLEQKGAYSMILDLIYVRGGPIPDSPQEIARQCGCSTRKWKQIRDDLIGMGKIYENEGHLSNGRADRELPLNEKEAEKLSENGVKGGEKTKKKSDKNEKENDENKTVSKENNDIEEKGLSILGKHTHADQIPDARSHIEDKQQQPCAISGAEQNDKPPVGGVVPDNAEDDLLYIPEFLRRKPPLADQHEPVEPRGETPSDLMVKTYLEARKEVFGTAYLASRPGMAGADNQAGATARRWIEAGASPELVREVALCELEKFKSRGNSFPPTVMHYLDSAIAAAIKAEKRPMPEGGGGYQARDQGGVHQDNESNTWRLRIKAFLQNEGFWMDRYGAIPTDRNCECPPDILAEFGYGPKAVKGSEQ